MAPNFQPLVDSVMSGRGLYAITDAAFYAKIPTSTLSDWFFGRKNREAFRDAEFKGFEDRFITFDEFVEALAIRYLRKRGFSLSEILDALSFAEAQYGVQNMFSHPEHRMATDSSKHLHLFLANESNPIQVSGKRGKGQQSFNLLVQDYLNFLTFENNKAIAYRPASILGHNIAMFPKKSFGEPIIEDVGYSVQTLSDSARAERSTARAADLYEVDESAVKAAVQYWNELEEARNRKSA
jgi:uncharacterized protein (DUF433 family)